MKKLLLLITLWAGFHSALKALDASVTFAAFNAPNNPYIEVYLYIHGSSIEHAMTPDSLYHSNIEIITVFKQRDSIIKADKFLLNGPLGKKRVSLYDIKRYGLDNGSYDMEIVLKDMNNEENSSVFRTKVDIDFSSNQLMQSDIQLLSTAISDDDANNPAVKNGVYMEALPFNFYNKSLSTLLFYNEIYNADQAIGDDFLVRYLIEKVNGNGSTETMLIANKKRSPDSVNPLLLSLDISKLPSANYHLIVEIRNRGGDLLSDKKIFFQRSNPYLDLELAQSAPLEEEFVANLSKEELRYSLKAIAPLVKDADVEVLNYVIANRDSIEAQRRFLFTFWAIESPVDTKSTYEKYMKVARWVDQEYKSGFGYGFETDRGYIFMRYGKPNDSKRVDNDPSAPPYEIWVYENFPRTNQNRVKFIFYNPSLSPGDFRLLHSTALSEVNNPQWEVELYRNVPNEIQGRDFINGTEMMDNVNRQARRLFEDM